MRYRIAFLLVVLFFPAIARSQILLTIEGGNKFLSAKGTVAYPRPVLRLDFFAKAKSISPKLPECLYANVWFSKSADRASVDTFGDEIDLKLGCEWNGFDGGIAYFKLFGKGVGDVLQPYLGFSKSFTPLENHTIAPCVKVEGEIPLGWSNGAKNGALISLCVSHRFTSGVLSFNQRAAFVYDLGGLKGFESGWMWRYDASFVWPVSNNFQFKFPIFRTILPLTIHDIRRNEYAVSGAVVLNY